MATHKTSGPAAVSCDEAIEILRGALTGAARRYIVAAITEGRDTGDAFRALRRCMRAHRWPTPEGTLDLRRVVDGLDARTRREGLHVLHGWDFRTQRRPDDIVPMLLADYCERVGVPLDGVERAVAILLDQYFLSLLMLPTVRAWDDGDPNVRLDAISGLIGALNGPGGGGLPIVDDAESLLVLAVAYYHPEESAYDDQLARVRTVDAAHALRFAFPCAAIVASHLRWGLRFMYRNDVGAMRADNVVDYPWSLFALGALMREYERLLGEGAPDDGRLRVAAALQDGLSPDPWAFDGKLPSFLSSCAAEHDALRAGLDRHRSALIADFETSGLPTGAYNPMGFSCNFLSNAVVASVVAAVGGAVGTPSLNVLLASGSDAGHVMAEGSESHGAVRTDPAELFAERLMAFAAGAPERLGAGGAPLIVYDRRDTAHYHNAVMRCLRAGAARA